MFERRQLIASRFSVIVISLSLLLAAGCSRDPNVRKHKYLESGKRYEADGKYREAMIQFTNATKVDKSFSDAYYEMAKTYMKMNSLGLAYGAYQRTVDLNGQNLDARINLGNLLLAGRADDRAQAQVKAVLAANPNYPDAYALQAAIDQKHGDHAQALKDIQHALALEPNRAGFHTDLALLEAGDQDKEGDAEQEFQKAASLDPKNSGPHMLLASLLEKKGDMQGAQQQLLAAKALEPKNLQARAALAGLYAHVGDQHNAEQTLRESVEDIQDSSMPSQMLAEYYAKSGQVDRAATVFQDLNSKYPKNTYIKLTYARILFAKKDFTKASAIASELTKSDPGNGDLQILNARILLGTGKTDDALALLKKSVKDNPNNLQALILLGQVEASKGNIADAESTYRQASKLNPGDVEAATGLAEIAMGRRDAGMLSELADTAFKTHPNSPAGYLWRGIAEAIRPEPEYDKAGADFEAALKLNPNNSLAYLELGLVRFHQGRTPDARTLIQTALDKDPNSIRALDLLVALDLQAKQPDKAIARVQAQIAKVPGNGHLYTELAALQHMNKDYKGELESARKAMQLDPSDARAMQFFSEAEVALNDVEAAVATWQSWLKSHPNDATALQMLGSLEEAKGDDSAAMEYYKKALQISPDDAVSANNLAYLMVENSDNSGDNMNVDVALTLAQTARRIRPNQAETADTLAWVYFHKDNYGAARDLLESALQTYPNDASINLHLGMVYAKLNDKTNAQIHLKKAATLAPNTKTGKDASAELAKLG